MLKLIAICVLFNANYYPKNVLKYTMYTKTHHADKFYLINTSNSHLVKTS